MRLIRQTTPTRRDLGFLAMALLIHSALLLLPIKAWQTHQNASKRPTELLRVRLQPAPKTSSNAVEPEPVAQAPEDEQTLRRLDQEKPAADYTLAEIPPPSYSQAPDNRPASDTSLSQTLSTQQLRHWVERADSLAQPQQDTRTLGTARSYQPPANWNRHAGAPLFASFDDRSHEATLPAGVAIVDRWQADDGSHQVLVHLPTGESLCGRAAAYDPMQPLVEPIMMFRSCGRIPSFTMPERYMKDR